MLLVGFLALTYIVSMPAQAGAHLDEAGTASLDRSPVTPVPPRSGTGPSDASASATVGGGGIGVPGLPVISQVRCLHQCVALDKPTRGAIIAVRGNNLDRVTRVVFQTRDGREPVRWRKRARGVVRVSVPRFAVPGFLVAVDARGNRARSPQRMSVLPKSAIPVEVFPVRGPFSWGSSGSRFGANRSSHRHQGQDLSAACGTRLVSIRRARVVYNRWDSGGGNYLVLRNLGTNTHFVYMHLHRRSPLREGQIVGAGAPIGMVGTTGRSSGCHLHFEYWVGPWQTGGRPIDPLPYLRSLRRR